MKNKTCIQLKKISKVFYGIFIAIAVIVFAVFAIQAFEEISSSNIEDGILKLILGLILILHGFELYLNSKSLSQNLKC